MNVSEKSRKDGKATLAVIGGAGFLGRALIERIAVSPDWQNWEVRCVDRVPFPATTPRPNCFCEFIGDANSLDMLGEALRGADVVWIRAATLGGNHSTDVTRCIEYCDNNVVLVGTILDACADTEQQTPECEPTAGNFYGATKLIAEKLLRLWVNKAPCDAPRSVQIMRYSRVRDGNTRDVICHMVAAALAEKPIRLLGNSDHRISFVHVSDVVHANLKALQLAPRFAIYLVATDRPIGLFDLAMRVRELVGRVTDKIVPIERTPVPQGLEWEPHVVGMRWEDSVWRLQLERPRGLDEMIEETISIQKSGRKD